MTTFVLSLFYPVSNIFAFRLAGPSAKLFAFFIPAAITGFASGLTATWLTLHTLRRSSPRGVAWVVTAYFVVISSLGMAIMGSDAMPELLAYLSLTRAIAVAASAWFAARLVERDRAASAF
ncbi:hypothetical protein ACRBEV_24915 [Methylobacterium phyllosphaerae]